MHHRSSRWLIAGATALAAAPWLAALAQAPGQTPTIQPAPSTQPAPNIEDPATLAAREQLISGLIGSKHDFTHGGRSGRDLCLPCHTPHLVAATKPRLDQRPPTTQPLRPYQALDIELTGWSLLCLGCHDGVTAPDVYSSGHAITVADQLATSRLGTSRLKSHPVGIRYPQASDPDYHPATAVEAAGMPLPDGRIQCTTCHDAHNTHNYDGMLKISNRRSRVCLTCHIR
jgi:predicted CXXCH cytochrome family protein